MRARSSTSVTNGYRRRARSCVTSCLAMSAMALRTGPVLAASAEDDGTPGDNAEAAAPNLEPGEDWPSPVADEELYLFLLADVLEYRPGAAGGDFRADVEGWYGGDRNRIWIQSEAQQDTALKANYDVDAQVLYGRFIARYYDFLVGAGVEAHKSRADVVTRAQATISIQGLVPYSYEVQPAIFISHTGDVSGRFTLVKDLLLTQRVVLQPRFEINAAIQGVEEFTIGPGLNNVELGLRVRYEIWRKFAPYAGVSFDRSFFETATLVREDGGDSSQLRFAVGIRMWL